MDLKFQPLRAARYYKLRFLRLKGDAESIARGVGLGIFIGITPTLPFHTIILLLLSPLLHANIIAALLAATVVCNPMTFFIQYYLCWKIGNWLLPNQVSWETIQALLDLFKAGSSFKETAVAFFHTGWQTLATLLTGGVVLAVLPALAGYLASKRIVGRFQRKRQAKRILS